MSVAVWRPLADKITERGVRLAIFKKPVTKSFSVNLLFQRNKFFFQLLFEFLFPSDILRGAK
jgi:hypothetical protein